MKKKYIPPRMQVYDIEPRTCIMQYSVKGYEDVNPENIGDLED